MNIFKRRPALILTLGLAIIITIGVSVYMGIIPTNKNIMLKHLEKKYGQEFEAWYITRVGYFPWSGYIAMDCYPKGGDPKTDSLKVEMDPNNKTSTGIKDGYFGILIREDVEAEVLAACADLPLPMKVYYRPSSYYDNRFDGTKTYADFKQWNDNEKYPRWLDVTVCVSADNFGESDKEIYANQIFDKLRKDNYYGMVNVLFYPGEAFEQLTRANKKELANQYREQYTNITKNMNLE